MIWNMAKGQGWAPLKVLSQDASSPRAAWSWFEPYHSPGVGKHGQGLISNFHLYLYHESCFFAGPYLKQISMKCILSPEACEESQQYQHSHHHYQYRVHFHCWMQRVACQWNRHNHRQPLRHIHQQKVCGYHPGPHDEYTGEIQISGNHLKNRHRPNLLYFLGVRNFLLENRLGVNWATQSRRRWFLAQKIKHI